MKKKSALNTLEVKCPFSEKRSRKIYYRNKFTKVRSDDTRNKMQRYSGCKDVYCMYINQMMKYKSLKGNFIKCFLTSRLTFPFLKVTY